MPEPQPAHLRGPQLGNGAAEGGLRHHQRTGGDIPGGLGSPAGAAAGGVAAMRSRPSMHNRTNDPSSFGGSWQASSAPQVLGLGASAKRLCPPHSRKESLTELKNLGITSLASSPQAVADGRPEASTELPRPRDRMGGERSDHPPTGANVNYQQPQYTTAAPTTNHPTTSSQAVGRLPPTLELPATNGAGGGAALPMPPRATSKLFTQDEIDRIFLSANLSLGFSTLLGGGSSAPASSENGANPGVSSSSSVLVTAPALSAPTLEAPATPRRKSGNLLSPTSPGSRAVSQEGVYDPSEVYGMYMSEGSPIMRTPEPNGSGLGRSSSGAKADGANERPPPPEKDLPREAMPRKNNATTKGNTDATKTAGIPVNSKITTNANTSAYGNTDLPNFLRADGTTPDYSDDEWSDIGDVPWSPPRRPSTMESNSAPATPSTAVVKEYFTPPAQPLLKKKPSDGKLRTTAMNSGGAGGPLTLITSPPPPRKESALNAIKNEGGPQLKRTDSTSVSKISPKSLQTQLPRSGTPVPSPTNKSPPAVRQQNAPVGKSNLGPRQASPGGPSGGAGTSNGGSGSVQQQQPQQQQQQQPISINPPAGQPWPPAFMSPLHLPNGMVSNPFPALYPSQAAAVAAAQLRMASMLPPNNANGGVNPNFPMSFNGSAGPVNFGGNGGPLLLPFYPPFMGPFVPGGLPLLPTTLTHPYIAGAMLTPPNSGPSPSPQLGPVSSSSHSASMPVWPSANPPPSPSARVTPPPGSAPHHQQQPNQPILPMATAANLMKLSSMQVPQRSTSRAHPNPTSPPATSGPRMPTMSNPQTPPTPVHNNPPNSGSPLTGNPFPQGFALLPGMQFPMQPFPQGPIPFNTPPHLHTPLPPHLLHSSNLAHAPLQQPPQPVQQQQQQQQPSHVAAWVAEVATIRPSEFERVVSFHAPSTLGRRSSSWIDDGIDVSDSVSRVGEAAATAEGARLHRSASAGARSRASNDRVPAVTLEKDKEKEREKENDGENDAGEEREDEAAFGKVVRRRASSKSLTWMRRSSVDLEGSGHTKTTRMPFATSPIAGSTPGHVTFVFLSRQVFEMQSETGELICTVERQMVSGGRSSFIAHDSLMQPICKLTPIEPSAPAAGAVGSADEPKLGHMDMALFQNQFGGMFVIQGRIVLLSSQTHSGRLTSQYLLSHDACETEFRMTVIDDTNQKTALFHLKDATTTLAELRWTPKHEFRCEMPIKGKKTPTVELLIAGAVMMRYGVRGAKGLKGT
ncbi:hypothetical protein HK101_004540 [Irineochytrium annulatum]|nr:hypothetical protein HK101_004540 [Irineochytrium annulatum]